MATLHLQNSVKQHTAYKTPSLTDNKINSAPKNVICSKRGETKGYGGDSDCHCLFQIGNFGNIYTKCWPKGGTFEET